MYGYTKGRSRLDEQNHRAHKAKKKKEEEEKEKEREKNKKDDDHEEDDEDKKDGKKSNQILNEMFKVKGFAQSDMLERFSNYLNKILKSRWDAFTHRKYNSFIAM